MYVPPPNPPTHHLPATQQSRVPLRAHLASMTSSTYFPGPGRLGGFGGAPGLPLLLACLRSAMQDFSLATHGFHTCTPIRFFHACVPEFRVCALGLPWASAWPYTTPAPVHASCMCTGACAGLAQRTYGQPCITKAPNLRLLTLASKQARKWCSGNAWPCREEPPTPVTWPWLKLC